jgi:hypothetical protein
VNLGSTTVVLMGKGPQKRKPDGGKAAEQRAAVALLRELQKGHGTGLALAKALGVSPSLVSEVLKPGASKPVGPTLARAMATLANVSIDEVWGRTPTRQVFKPERYPNLETAITTAASLLGAHLDEAAQRARSIAMHYPTDRSVGEWVDELQSIARSIRRAAKTGETYGERALEDDDDTPKGDQ